MKELTDEEIEKAAFLFYPDTETESWAGERAVFKSGSIFARDRQKEIDRKEIERLKGVLNSIASENYDDDDGKTELRNIIDELKRFARELPYMNKDDLTKYVDDAVRKASDTFIQDQFLASRDVLNKFINSDQMEVVKEAGQLLFGCLANGHKVIAIGNGGSNSDAAHFAAELTGRFKKDRKPLRALTVTDPAHLTCVSNDFGYQCVFERFVEAHGDPGDVLLAISTSGNSHNVNNAIYMAKSKRMAIIGLTGHNITSEMFRIPGVKLIQVPSTDTRLIQEVHIKIIHVLVMLIERGMGL